MAEHTDHSRCFRTSGLSNPCTLLELMSWADQIVTAAEDGRVRLTNGGLTDAVDEWHEVNEHHTFVLDELHLNCIMIMYHVDPSSPGAFRYTDEVYLGRSPEDLHEFLYTLLTHLSYPFALWNRVLVDLTRLSFKTAGFLYLNGQLKWLDTRWPGFSEIITRDNDPLLQTFVGCPTTSEISEDLVLELISNGPFIDDYMQSHRSRLASALAKALKKFKLPSESNFTREEVEEALKDKIGEAHTAVLQAIRPFVADLCDAYMVFIDKQRVENSNDDDDDDNEG